MKRLFPRLRLFVARPAAFRRLSVETQCYLLSVL